jgi:hypothetical protein
MSEIESAVGDFQRDATTLVVRIGAALDGFTAALEEASRAFIALGEAMGIKRSRPLTVPGRWAYDLATLFGFAHLDVLAWLETCPGAR